MGKATVIAAAVTVTGSVVLFGAGGTPLVDVPVGPGPPTTLSRRSRH